ncbi:cell division ATP-binding protein FtsE [Helicobacter suis]|uniref:Cell division protein FtsE n=2 Tax=Helicobacter suis TaxID=104628 RepID=E7G3C1_9HELI|nr:ABC transporter ATP-binding protein [Helicobacter suis]EFX42141.1 cell division protein FtsE [Helicobacter suis HS5]EFX43611.1 cell division protein [Helicobacter suis HS1]BCD45517.1 Cell division protein FtsE [Helicobacter suis]BCD47170.1 Cell division protein FtsE [Helicobacter suis]BCD48925.1 Cell division protein FtsE [Helicobacter suis]
MSSIIFARDLSLGYKRDEWVIKGAHFKIERKDFVFISGASGSGKSTLLRSLYGDLPILGGDLEVCNISVNRASKTFINELRRNIGVVFQDYKLIEEWTVEQNIKLPMIINGYKKEECSIQAEKLLAHVDLLYKSNRYPLELSGGEQQRVAMARAIAHKPFLILADEPTGNLDDYSSDMIWSLLKGANKQLDITIVVVTHRIPSNFNIPYRKIYIKDGEIHEYT